MSVKSNVIAPAGITLGALGVLGFSFSLPATRLAVAGLDPWFVAFGRAFGAGLLAIGYLVAVRAPRPTRVQLRRLVVVALGIVVGFPLMTSLALQIETSAHGAVVIAGLPMATAIWAVLRAGEHPRPAFWLASGFGFVAVLTFVFTSGGVGGGFGVADVFLLVAVVLCGLGYAEGGVVARELGGAHTVCWALVVSLPVTVPVTVIVAATSGVDRADGTAWFGFGYVTVISMFLGFFAWYAGLAAGGVAKVSQVQLAQPILTLAWSSLFLHEQIGWITVVTAIVVLTCVVWTQRARVHHVGNG
ncbi:DMT family transporter [Actinocrispum wychmicini]|uniref:Drug/metabolite transporter (DMT)-like permease n=1 Tax=Actinocrispum wychmicini TaxID=1213861 RepID=A0A4R2JRC3_9PSEU|nr:DMT family transporter [Actinocrispum wychmicini]TCO56725.1 drug/metabolite transporter (DMT)-like permease [Actinocrispum wychmicini]